MPESKFLFNRASMTIGSNPSDPNVKSINKSPLQLQSALNASFKLNSPPNSSVKSVGGIKHLPKRVKDLAIALGINSSHLFEKMRTKELTAQLTDKIDAGIKDNSHQKPDKSNPIQLQPIIPNKITIKGKEIATQTNELKCDVCVERNKRVMINQHTQVFLKNASIGTQTNEKDYREPIVEQLSKMTAAQLVAIKDFANMIVEPRPQNTAELFKLKERMMDVYNLSQRDADAVRIAEENRLDDVNYIERLRYRTSGDVYSNENSREFDRSLQSPPRFDAAPSSSASNFGNFEQSNFNSDRHSLVDDNEVQQRLFDEREYQRIQRAREEEEHQKFIDMERNREIALELEQRRYDAERRREDELRSHIFEQQQQKEHHLRQLAIQQQQSPFRFEDDGRGFNREIDERDPRTSVFNINQGSTINRRSRGAFRGRRRMI